MWIVNLHQTLNPLWQRYADEALYCGWLYLDSRKDIDVRFFQLPTVEWIFKRWLNLIRREALNVDPTVDNRHNVVCSNHFVDGCPTFKNHLPTLFVFNILKQKHSYKTKNSHQGRTPDIKCNTIEPFPKRAKLIKCHTDKTLLCYHYVSGEIDSSNCNTDYIIIPYPNYIISWNMYKIS